MKKELKQTMLVMAIAVLQAGCLSLRAEEPKETSPRIMSMRITQEYLPNGRNKTEVTIEMRFRVQKKSIVDMYPNHYLIEVSIDGQPFKQVLHQHIRRPWLEKDLKEFIADTPIQTQWRFQLTDQLPRPTKSVQLRLTYPSGEDSDNRAVQWARNSQKPLWAGTLASDILTLTEEKEAPTKPLTATE